jgi:glyoxylase-like metal-dependent hydrolase (beta-lactamase superfamily II)
MAPPELIMAGCWRVGGGSWGDVVACVSVEEDCNVYLIQLPDALVLVDCGTSEGTTYVSQNIASLGHERSEITDILLTHSHWDHTQAVCEWKEMSAATVHLSAVATAFLSRGDHRLIGYHLHGPEYVYPLFAVDHSVSDGEHFLFGNTDVLAKSLPGHTPDSTLYLFEHQVGRIGISGDIVFAPNTTQKGVLGFLSALWLSDLDGYVASLRRLLELKIDVLLPGHGKVVFGRDEVREVVLDCLATAEFLADDERVRGNFYV